MDMKTFKTQFDDLLKVYLEQKIQTLHHYHGDKKLEQVIAYIVQFAQGGKRIRPYLVYIFYKACGGLDDEYAMHYGITNEMIHLYGLIHDDIADE